MRSNGASRMVLGLFIQVEASGVLRVLTADLELQLPMNIISIMSYD